MDNNILKLYPQFIPSADRRGENKSVDCDRRVEERRQIARLYDPRLNQDVSNIKNIFTGLVNNADKFQKSFANNKAAFAALSPITPLRRVSSLQENIEDGNYSRATGLITLALVNLPEDTRDLKSATKQIFKNELPEYDYKNYQAPFSFFRGTILEPLINKMDKSGVKLHQWDNTLYDTKLGRFLRETFNISIDNINSESTGRLVPLVAIDESGKTVIKKVEVLAYEVKGKPFAKLIGRALLRIPIISFIALSLLELPAIIKKVRNAEGAKDKIKQGSIQTLKAGINITSILAGIGIIGALFARKGPAYSLLGMGIGSVSGALLSKSTQNQVDKYIKKN